MKPNNQSPSGEEAIHLSENMFNPHGYEFLNDDKALFDGPPDMEVPGYFSAPQTQPAYVSASVPAPVSAMDPYVSLLNPGVPEATIPELDFPVPAPDVIPGMVFENDFSKEEYPSPDSFYVAIATPELGENTIQRSPAARGVPDRVLPGSNYPVIPPTGTHSPQESLSSSTASPMAPPVTLSSASSVPPSVAYPPVPASNNTPSSAEAYSITAGLDPRIPIQSSYVAHARVGALSAGAIQERRARNTQSARRSRARRADKLTELREENRLLSMRNNELVAENAKLKHIIEALGSGHIARCKDVKHEVSESPYQSF